MKNMKDIFGKKADMGKDPMSSPMGSPMGDPMSDPMGDPGMEDPMGDMGDMGDMGGSLESALAGAGYPNVTPDQVEQIKQILGEPDSGMDTEENLDAMGDIGGGELPELPPM